MIITLMNKTLSFYWFPILLSGFCNFKNVFSEETIPVRVNYKGKYTSDINDYEIVVPQRVNEDGSFISHLVSHRHSKRSTKELEFIFYKIPIEGKDYLIELTPNRKLISPGAIVETHKEYVGESADLTFSNESSKNVKIGKIFRNLDIRKLENTDCHFSGTVKGENTSKAALSTCYGLAGFIQIPEGFYTIEPVAEHDPFVEDAYPHILYKTGGLENSSVCHTMGELAASLVRKRRETNLGSSLPMYVETLIVLDKALINHYVDTDCENYILTVFNMAFNLFHDASSGLMMALTIVRIIRLETENDEMNLKVNSDAEKTLKYFQNWQYEINPGDDSHPNHHDIAMLITRVNVCYSRSSCGLLGLTTIGKACDPKLSAALCEDNGLRLGYVIAHEIGHLLGADHDSENSTCNGTDAYGLKTVMHPHVSLTAQTWSPCSQAYFKAFFSSGSGNCFLDEPEEHHFNVQDLLPGVMYNADFQCKHMISMNARECDMGSTCDSLNCYVPEYACIVTHSPPADGTCCGENMWCHDSKCLVVGERPGAVDGNWGEWSAWSDCSRTCGSGVANSVRNCDKPQPSHGGKYCVGERKRYKICAATPCETGRPSFRDIQCGEFNDWIYPEDGKVHTWTAYFFHDDNPCTLYCINENKQVSALRPRVVDGTMCYKGIRDICVGGVCKSLPCDLHFESNAVEDACGVCHGDGTGCEFSEGKETFIKTSKGLTKLVNVPSGSRNIKVEELTPTSSKIIVKDKDTKDVYIKGNSLGMFSVPGSQAWVGMIKKNQQALNIPGPVTKPLSIWIQRSDRVTVKWSMALPAEQQRKPEFAWDFLKWGPCSAKCGPGTQISKPSCVEGKAGLVEDSFCADLEAPLPKVRQCIVAKCEPRWMVGDWKGCDQSSSQRKERKRIVYCVKPIGEGEGESQIVPDLECPSPKPHESEPCENRKKREDNEYNVADVPEVDAALKSDTSEFGFHKKYDDYLKHFTALSVPQRNSETIPFHLVSSPHFKHYFHVLETPEDPDTDSDWPTNLTSPNGTSYEEQAHTKVSPDFYKETFSGQQIGVTHIQSASQENAVEERRKKKSVSSWGGSRHERGRTGFSLRIKNRPKRLKSKRRRKSPVEFVRKRGSAAKTREDPSRGVPERKHKIFLRKDPNRNFNYTSPNLTNFIESLGENEKSFFSYLMRRGREKMADSERTKLRNSHWRTFAHKRSSFFSFFSKNKAKAKKELAPLRAARTKFVRPHSKGFDGSGLRKLPLRGSENSLKDGETDDIEKWVKKERSSFAGAPLGGKPNRRPSTGFKEKHTSLEELFSEMRGEKSVREKNQKKRAPLRRERKSFRKRKRSSRIWKKPKSKDTKDQPGSTGGGTEAKNYLNNLFRDAHPKASSAKPSQGSGPQAESCRRLEKPVIKEGVLVIDRDSSEDQEIEIIFEGDEGGGKQKKFVELPQPARNEKKLVIKGQDVFNLFQELQKRSGRESFCRSHAPSEKLEINIKVPEKSMETQTTVKPTTAETKTTEQIKQTEGAKQTTKEVHTLSTTSGGMTGTILTETAEQTKQTEGTKQTTQEAHSSATTPQETKETNAITTPIPKTTEVRETAEEEKTTPMTPEETQPPTTPSSGGQNTTETEIDDFDNYKCDEEDDTQQVSKSKEDSTSPKKKGKKIKVKGKEKKKKKERKKKKKKKRKKMRYKERSWPSDRLWEKPENEKTTKNH